jgi:hypothetical protein
MKEQVRIRFSDVGQLELTIFDENFVVTVVLLQLYHFYGT